MKIRNNEFSIKLEEFNLGSYNLNKLTQEGTFCVPIPFRPMI